MSFDDDFSIDITKIKHEVYVEGDDNNSQKINYPINYNNNDDDDFDITKVKKENYIQNLVEEQNPDIGFDFNLLERNELHVNLIHFDLKMTNEENYRYFSKFKVDVIGGFHAMDELEIFEKYLKAIENKNIPFIVISSGTSGKDVIPICRKYSFVKEVIIFCSNYNYNKHYLKEYPGYVKKVFTLIDEVYNYIKTFGEKYKDGIKKYKISNHFIFPSELIKMNRQLEQCPVISAYEYDNCYFLVHRAYAHFFLDMNNKNLKPEFKSGNFNVIKKFINESQIIKVEKKNDLINKFEKLKNSDNFVELAIRTYTGESDFCYLFNRTMRNFEKGLISLAYYMGPFLYGVNKYVKENPKYSFKKDMILYRNIECSKLDFYLYKINLHHIICFPSITSTSLKKNNFHPTPLAKELNQTGISKDDIVKITMIFKYKHSFGNISPGIIVRDYKGVYSGEYLSSVHTEEEVILFPFTFVRINKIENKCENNVKYYEMNLEIINRNSYIEYTLKNNVQNRFKFSNLD